MCGFASNPILHQQSSFAFWNQYKNIFLYSQLVSTQILGTNDRNGHFSWWRHKSIKVRLGGEYWLVPRVISLMGEWNESGLEVGWWIAGVLTRFSLSMFNDVYSLECSFVLILIIQITINSLSWGGKNAEKFCFCHKSYYSHKNPTVRHRYRRRIPNSRETYKLYAKTHSSLLREATTVIITTTPRFGARKHVWRHIWRLFLKTQRLGTFLLFW